MSEAEHAATGSRRDSTHHWNAESAIEILRIGTGIVWCLNLIFILDPRNQYWSTFSQTALSFAPSTVGGPGLAQFVAAHPEVFSWSIALITGYLAVALVLGLTTRIACFVGGFFSAVLLATQFGTTFLFPGGTDVGAHPLYILAYGVMVVGGAGRMWSVDHWLRVRLADRRAARPVPRAPASPAWATAVSPRTLFTYFVAGTLVSLGVGFGLTVAIPVGPAFPNSTTVTGPVHYVNLSVGLNPINGWPQYSPANFSVPGGRVIFTITDTDMPMNWTRCPCPVLGAVGGVELVNGSPVNVVSSNDVAHTFNIPDLGLQILSPGLSVVKFTLDLTHAGHFVWLCLAPCGTGADPYNSPPMGIPGYMTGTLTVT